MLLNRPGKVVKMDVKVTRENEGFERMRPTDVEEWEPSEVGIGLSGIEWVNAFWYYVSYV